MIGRLAAMCKGKSTLSPFLPRFYTAGQVTGAAVNVGLAFGNPCALGAGMRAGLQLINGAGDWWQHQCC